jgi:hypothetical protein
MLVTMNSGRRKPFPGTCAGAVLSCAIAVFCYFPGTVFAQDEVRKEIERRYHQEQERKAVTGTPGGQPVQSWQLFRADDYLALPDYEREFYVAGLNDAYNWSYSGGFSRMKWMVPCVSGRKARQLTAMFDKWLKQNPERWHEPAAKLYPFAIFELCRKAQQPPGADSGAKKKSGK